MFSLVFQWSRTCPWRSFSFCWLFWQGCSSCLAHPVQYLFKNQYYSLVFQCRSRVPLQFLRLGRSSVVHHLLLSVLSTSPFCFSLTFLRIYFCFLHQFFRKSKPHYSPGVLIRFPFSRSIWFLIDRRFAVSRGQFVTSIIWLTSTPGKFKATVYLVLTNGTKISSLLMLGLGLSERWNYWERLKEQKHCKLFQCNTGKTFYDQPCTLKTYYQHLHLKMVRKKSQSHSIPLSVLRDLWRWLYCSDTLCEKLSQYHDCTHCHTATFKVLLWRFLCNMDTGGCWKIAIPGTSKIYNLTAELHKLQLCLCGNFVHNEWRWSAVRL